MRDLHNLKHGWVRPDDPKRARLYQPGVSALNNKIDAKKEINDYLAKCIAAGLVTDREGVKNKFSEIGQITREGKDYISIKSHGFTRAIRLKGGYIMQNSIQELQLILVEKTKVELEKTEQIANQEFEKLRSDLKARLQSVLNTTEQDTEQVGKSLRANIQKLEQESLRMKKFAIWPMIVLLLLLAVLCTLGISGSKFIIQRELSGITDLREKSTAIQAEIASLEHQKKEVANRLESMKNKVLATMELEKINVITQRNSMFLVFPKNSKQQLELYLSQEGQWVLK